jgi:hypothetical protein
MTQDAARSFLSAEPVRTHPAPPPGGLIRAAERFARRRDPKHTAPLRHLAPLAASCEEALRAIRREAPPVFTVAHLPVQHGKTTLLQAFVLYVLKHWPRARIGYGSFNNERAEGKMWEVRELAPAFGIRLHPSFATRSEWRTEAGGLVYAGGVIGGKWTGQGFDLLILDDLYKGSEEADSAAHRAKVMASIDDGIMTRAQDWTSVIVSMARWNPHDASGELIKRGWPYLCRPAIDDDGEALAPWMVAKERLLALRDGRPESPGRPRIDAIPRRTWWSLYQGQPRPEEGRIFDLANLATYETLPGGAFVEALGLDLAYGEKQQHDRSAYTVFRRYATDPRRLYRVECDARHAPIELYAARVAEVQLRRGGFARRLVLPTKPRDLAAWQEGLRAEDVRRARRIAARWYTSTTEAGTASLMSGYGASVEAIGVGRRNKLVRATSGGYTSAWSEGRIVAPARENEQGERWRLSHEDFTGEEGCADDEVDSAVAAHDVLALPVASLRDTRARAGGSWGYSGEREA